mmetsp:Transcript_22678/g.66028  ORF Transcript_22678/g.66028 Transcript_22678/m.66028 type:complete len:226 (-) Transcript_22678:144-821(-)
MKGGLACLLLALRLVAEVSGEVAVRISCPAECLCMNVYRTVVDCSFQGLASLPRELPNTTHTLLLQGNHITFLPSEVMATAFTTEGTSYETPLRGLQVLRLDRNPINNISYRILETDPWKSVDWIYLPSGVQTVEQTPLRLVHHDIETGFQRVPPHPFELRDYEVWARDRLNPMMNSRKDIQLADIEDRRQAAARCMLLYHGDAGAQQRCKPLLDAARWWEWESS